MRGSPPLRAVLVRLALHGVTMAQTNMSRHYERAGKCTDLSRLAASRRSRSRTLMEQPRLFPPDFTVPRAMFVAFRSDSPRRSSTI